MFAFIFSVTGYLMGSKIGRFFGNNVEIAGGAILIGIGVKILVEHLI